LAEIFQEFAEDNDTEALLASLRFFFHVMASLAEMERGLTMERTRAGLEMGRVGGRKMTDSKLESAVKLLAGDVAKNLGVSVPTLYRWLPATS
jgi:DNA invertase Pin-like site-specific DNA recombinase